ncbi:MAG: hypothetical protein JO356_07375 [Acidobacteria bacterium]|nr:hypothetical protein [Acidobacteriota bacterium]
MRKAWKYTSRHQTARIEFGASQQQQQTVYFLRDDGSGFDPHSADRLFQAFQRLHSKSEFPGNGVGLATVRRIIQRHGGEVWAQGAVAQGPSSLPSDQVRPTAGVMVSGLRKPRFTMLYNAQRDRALLTALDSRALNIFLHSSPVSFEERSGSLSVWFQTCFRDRAIPNT